MPDCLTSHLPVLPDAVREAFTMAPGFVIDATAGGGGHTAILLELGHRVLALDRDPRAIARLERRFAAECAEGRLELRRAAFSTVAALGPCDGVLADLGWSSDQMEDDSRGLSFSSDSPPDMRFDPTLALSAADLIAASSADELARIFREYGEERAARRLGRALAGQRFASSRELAEAISRAKGGRRGRIHPATQAFQALRIAVNHELDELRSLLAAAPQFIRPGGRIAVIAFHSLEDRLVKRTFRSWLGECVCPPKLPVCNCRCKALSSPLWKGARSADEKEVRQNPRARSARMRAMVMNAAEK